MIVAPHLFSYSLLYDLVVFWGEVKMQKVPCGFYIGMLKNILLLPPYGKQ